jgi:hypothetical protein
MNIVILGVSRSGKNHLIEHLVKEINEKCPETLFFLNGSEKLKQFSDQQFAIPLSETTEVQKQKLRSMFCSFLKEFEKIKKYKHIIVDGHYCFPFGDDFKTAFTNEERDVFDMFFYLDTPANTIITNATKGDHNHEMANMPVEDINRWKTKEINGLRKSLWQVDKELIILDSCIEEIILFFEFILLSHGDLIWDEKAIARKLISENENFIRRYEKILLLDCDRTLSIDDTTYAFCEQMKIGKHLIKEIYAGEKYTLFQFFRAAVLYSKIDLALYQQAAVYAANNAMINYALIEDINKNGREFLSIGITSGTLQTWKNIKTYIHFPDIVLGGSNLRLGKTIVSRFVKYQMAKLLRGMGKYVIAVGDSSIDVQMLEEADKGYIIANSKLNDGMVKYFNCKNSRIMQLSYSDVQYSDIPSQKSLFV